MKGLAILLLTICSWIAAAPQAGAQQVLERSPTQWARAPAGTWDGWDANSAPPEALKPYLLRAIEAYGLGDMPAVLTALYELLDKAPDYPPALHQAGVVYFRLRRYGDAILAFERYLELAPQRVGDTRMLGHCYYSLGDYERARAHYNKVLAVQPASVEAQRGLGLALMRLGEPEAALASLKHVLELDPQHANAATWVAQILFDEERGEEALQAALRARDLDPFEPRAWFLLSQVQYDLGQDEQGEVAQLRFEELNRIAQQIRTNEGRLLFNPRQPDVYQQLILLHRAAGDRQRVGGVLNRWLQVDPGRVRTRIALLDLAEELHDRNMTQRVAASLQGAAGDSVEAWQRLLRYYTDRKDRVQQIEAEGQLARLRR